MVFRPLQQHAWLLGVLLLGGCLYPVRDNIDLAVDSLVKQTIDTAPAVDTSMARPDGKLPRKEDSDPKEGRRPLTLPPGLPGEEAPGIRLPDHDDADYKKKLEETYKKLYPALPGIGNDPTIQPGPEGKPLTLANLHRLALANNPTIRQAAADVETARGAAIKAAAYPNPNVGYEADTVNTGGTAGFQGAFIDQVIKTGGKLKLAWAAAQMDLDNAQLALRRAQTDLTAQVRGGYFAVLVAWENVRINKALAALTDQAFRIQVDIVEAGPAGPYEPMALRVLAYQARINLLQARNRYVSAWKQLTASLGLPGMPPTELAGGVDLPIPVYDFKKVQDRILTNHTDVLTARNTLLKARYNLKLAQVVPVPDVDVRAVVQKDFSMPPFLITHSVQVTVPVPIWDSNKGGIIQAQGQLVRSVEESDRVRSALIQSLADAFERYENNRRIIVYYRDRILPDQARVFKGTYDRHGQAPNEVGFQDVVSALQTYVGVLSTYTSTLTLEWQAVVDVAHLVQTNDLFRVGGELVENECVVPLLALEELPALPCCHPSSSLHEPHLKGADPHWPPALPNPSAKNPSKKNAARNPEEVQILDAEP